MMTNGIDAQDEQTKKGGREQGEKVVERSVVVATHRHVLGVDVLGHDRRPSGDKSCGSGTRRATRCASGQRDTRKHISWKHNCSGLLPMCSHENVRLEKKNG